MSSSAEARALMRRRAVALAEVADQVEQVPMRELLVVTVADRSFALDVSHVRQILSNARLCTLPADGGHLLGIVAARGDVVPVADLGALLDVAPLDRARRHLVVVEGDEPSIGLLVDEVCAVARVVETDIRRQPGLDSAECGVTPDGVVVLDIARLLSDPRLTHPLPAPAAADRTHRGDPCPT